MKPELTQLLLALSLVMNLVAVIAGDFHPVEMQASHAIEKALDDLLDEPKKDQYPTLPQTSECEKSCCGDVSCFEQGVCFIPYTPAVITPTSLEFTLSNESGG